MYIYFLLVFLNLFSFQPTLAAPSCERFYNSRQLESPNAMTSVQSYKNTISRTLTDFTELIEDLAQKNPLFSSKINDFITNVNGKTFVDGGAGLSLYGVQLAKKGANVHAFNAQNFISVFNNFFDPVFLSKFIPSRPLGDGRETYSYANFIKATVHEGKLDFPIDGYILNHMAEILGQKYELNKYTSRFPVATSAEVAEMRLYLYKLAKDYLNLLKSLGVDNKFNYHVMFDDQFFKNIQASSIDRYIDFNGAFYYKRNKIDYLDTLLNRLSPGGQAVLVLDNGASRFKVGERSLGEYLATKWPDIFSVEHITYTGVQNDSITQQVLFITKPTNQHIPVLSKALAIEENEFTTGSNIPRTKIKELKQY